MTLKLTNLALLCTIPCYNSQTIYLQYLTFYLSLVYFLKYSVISFSTPLYCHFMFIIAMLCWGSCSECICRKIAYVTYDENIVTQIAFTIYMQNKWLRHWLVTYSAPRHYPRKMLIYCNGYHVIWYLGCIRNLANSFRCTDPSSYSGLSTNLKGQIKLLGFSGCVLSNVWNLSNKGNNMRCATCSDRESLFNCYII